MQTFVAGLEIHTYTYQLSRDRLSKQLGRLLAGLPGTNPAAAERARGARRQPQVDAVAVVDMAAGGQQLHHGADLDDAEADRALGLACALAAVLDQPVVHERREASRGGAQRRQQLLLLRVVITSCC